MENISVNSGNPKLPVIIHKYRLIYPSAPVLYAGGKPICNSRIELEFETNMQCKKNDLIRIINDLITAIEHDQSID